MGQKYVMQDRGYYQDGTYYPAGTPYEIRPGTKPQDGALLWPEMTKPSETKASGLKAAAPATSQAKT